MGTKIVHSVRRSSYVVVNACIIDMLSLVLLLPRCIVAAAAAVAAFARYRMLRSMRFTTFLSEDSFGVP